MSFISSVPMNVAGPPPSVLPLAVAAAMGAAGTSPTAKLLLPNAVTAQVAVPAFAEAPKFPGKTTMAKLVTSQPSSALTAQLLAQTPESELQNLSAFTPRPSVTANPDQQQNPQTANTAPQTGAPVAEQAKPQTPAQAAAPSPQQQAAAATTTASQTAQAPSATILPFVANNPEPTTTQNEQQNAETDAPETPSASGKPGKPGSTTQRGMNAYNAASRAAEDRSEYAVETVG